MGLNQVVSLKSFVPYNTYSNIDKGILHKKRKHFRQAIRDRKEQWYSEKPPQGHKTSQEGDEDMGFSLLSSSKKKNKKSKDDKKEKRNKKKRVRKMKVLNNQRRK